MRKEFTEYKSLLFSFVFLICFFIINFLRGSIFNSINQAIDLWAASINNGFFTIPAIIISITFDTAALAIISLAIGGLLFVFHYRRYCLLLLSSMAGAALLVEIFKMLIRSSRPLNEILRTTSYSFPSGHVTSTVVFFGILTYFVWKHWHTIKTKVIICVAYPFIISIVSFDRIYLNVHWFSDVVGAIFLGSFWLAFCIYIFNLISFKKQDNRRQKSMILSCSSARGFKKSNSSASISAVYSLYLAQRASKRLCYFIDYGTLMTVALSQNKI